VTGDCRRLHNVGLYELCSSPRIIRVIKPRRRWARHVTRTGERRGACIFWWLNLRERDNFEDLGIDGIAMLE
jgi:hypothetical protein